MQDKIITYKSDQGDVKLSPAIIRKYLVSGNGNVTDQEVAMFLQLCRYQKLNPFLRDAYLIKFGNSPATMVTGKDLFTKRAAASGLCNGWEAGVIVKHGNGIEQRTGTFVLAEEELVGGWAKVHRKDWNVPLEISVSLSEYMRCKSDGKPMSNWASMPATMIRKVALVQALREAMPDQFQGLYSAEEMPVDNSTLDTKPIDVPSEPPREDKPEPSPEEQALLQLRQEVGRFFKQLKEAGKTEEFFEQVKTEALSVGEEGTHQYYLKVIELLNGHIEPEGDSE